MDHQAANSRNPSDAGHEAYIAACLEAVQAAGVEVEDIDGRGEGWLAELYRLATCEPVNGAVRPDVMAAPALRVPVPGQVAAWASEIAGGGWAGVYAGTSLDHDEV